MCAVALLLSVLPLSAAAQPVLAFGEDAVTASGLTPASGALLLRVSREPKGYGVRLVTDIRLLDDSDRDGVMTLPLGRPVPVDSVWIAADRDSAASAVASPQRAADHQLEKLQLGQLNQLTRDGDHLLVVLVRPGEGAWVQILEDSGIYDADFTADWKVRFDVERMQPVGDSPSAPRTLARTDAVFIVDLTTLAVTELRSE